MDLINYGYNCLVDNEPEQKWRINTNYNATFSQGMLTNIFDGLGNISTINYSSLATQDNYSADLTNNLYPIGVVPSSLYVVKSVSTTNGIAGNSITSYSYKDATLHRYLGFLGFGQVSTTNSLTNITNQNNYSFLFSKDGINKYLPYLVSSYTKQGSTILQKSDNINYNIIEHTDINRSNI
jgi:hypothetical protein